MDNENRWSEGIMGNGAVILYDGQPVPIEDVLHHLNETEHTKDLLLRAAIYVLATAKPEYELHPTKGPAQTLLKDINKVLHGQ